MPRLGAGGGLGAAMLERRPALPGAAAPALTELDGDTDTDAFGSAREQAKKHSASPPADSIRQRCATRAAKPKNLLTF
jgi:hypothetical protein